MVKGIILTLIAGVAYGFAPVISTLIYNNGGDPLTLVFLRYAYMIPITAAIIWIKKIDIRISFHQLKRLIFVGIGCSLVSSLTLYMSYQWIDPGISTAIHFMYPVIIVLLSFVLFKEKIEKKTFFSLVLTIIGVISIVELGDSGNILGIICAITSAFAYSFYLLLNEKWRLANLDNIVYLFYISIACTLTMLLLTPFGFNINLNQPLINHGVMIVVAILTSFIGLLLMKEGVRILGSKIASVISMSEPIAAMVFSYLLLGSKITPSMIIGVVLIITAILVLLYDKKKES